MKVLVFSFLTLLIVSSSGDYKLRVQAVNDPFDDVINFLTGFLTYLDPTEDIHDVITCIKNIKNIEQDVMVIIDDIGKIVDDFKHFDIEHLLDIIKGIQDLVKQVSKIFTIIQQCVKSGSELEKIIEKFEHIKFDWDFLFKIIKHAIFYGGKIVHDITDLPSAWADKDYYRFGKDIGDLIYELILTDLSQLRDPYADVINFLVGFLTKIDPKEDIHDVIECVKNLESIETDIMTIINDMSRIIKDFEHFDIAHLKDIIEGCQDMADQVAKIFGVIDDCVKTGSELEKIIKEFEKIHFTWDYLYTIIKNAIFYGGQIKKDILDIPKAWADKN